MKTLVCFIGLCVAVAMAVAVAAPPLPPSANVPTGEGEYIILTGGVSLMVWEKYKAQPHDNWWMNFIRASRLRIQQLQTANPNVRITWLVYRPSYIARAKQEKNDLALIVSTPPARAAAVFTRNMVQAAPVRLARKHLAASKGRVAAVVINAGNANCATRTGDRVALLSSRAFAKAIAVVFCPSRMVTRLPARSIAVIEFGP